MDLYSRLIVGSSMGQRIDKHLFCDALTTELWRRGFTKGVIIHFDRGGQYASKKYKKLLDKYKLIGSMNRKGNCWDNACLQTLFRSINVECVYELSILPVKWQSRVCLNK